MAGETMVRGPSNGNVMEADQGSPVNVLLAKRLRALRKKLRGIEDIEAKRVSAQAMTADQEAALKGKATALEASIEELERTAKVIRAPLEEERSAARAEGEAAAAAAYVPPKPTKSDEEWEAEREAAVAAATEAARAPLVRELAEARAAAAAEAAVAAAAADEREAAAAASGRAMVARLLELLYYAAALDPFALQHEMAHYERHVCLMNAAQAGSPLSPAEISSLAMFSRMITSRVFNSHLSHAEALGLATEVALRALTTPGEVVLGEATTGEDLLETVRRISALDYVTLVPSLQAGGSDVGGGMPPAPGGAPIRTGSRGPAVGGYGAPRSGSRGDGAAISVGPPIRQPSPAAAPAPKLAAGAPEPVPLPPAPAHAPLSNGAAATEVEEERLRRHQQQQEQQQQGGAFPPAAAGSSLVERFFGSSRRSSSGSGEVVIESGRPQPRDEPVGEAPPAETSPPTQQPPSGDAAVEQVSSAPTPPPAPKPTVIAVPISAVRDAGQGTGYGRGRGGPGGRQAGGSGAGRGRYGGRSGGGRARAGAQGEHAHQYQQQQQSAGYRGGRGPRPGPARSGTPSSQ